MKKRAKLFFGLMTIGIIATVLPLTLTSCNAKNGSENNKNEDNIVVPIETENPNPEEELEDTIPDEAEQDPALPESNPEQAPTEEIGSEIPQDSLGKFDPLDGIDIPVSEEIELVPTGINQNEYYYDYLIISIVDNADDTYVKVLGLKPDTIINNIEIPSSINFENGLIETLEIGDEAFANCSMLENVTLPNTVLSIGIRAFEGCGNLETINLGNSLINIGNNAFLHCRELKSIDLPESLINIESFAFAYCHSLESINIPNFVQVIGNNAFVGC
jgi:hypothetical protein